MEFRNLYSTPENIGLMLRSLELTEVRLNEKWAVWDLYGDADELGCYWVLHVNGLKIDSLLLSVQYSPLGWVELSKNAHSI